MDLKEQGKRPSPTAHRCAWEQRCSVRALARGGSLRVQASCTLSLNYKSVRKSCSAMEIIILWAFLVAFSPLLLAPRNNNTITPVEHIQSGTGHSHWLSSIKKFQLHLQARSSDSILHDANFLDLKRSFGTSIMNALWCRMWYIWPATAQSMSDWLK